MWIQQDRRWPEFLLASIVALSCLTSAESWAAKRSQLSYWLSDTALEEIRALASRHPRLAHRSIHVSARGTTALDEAIAITLRDGLSGSKNLQVIVPTGNVRRQSSLSASVDDLHCRSPIAWENELQVAVLELSGRRVEVRLDLVDTAEPGVAFQTWRWRGSLSGPEREYLAMPARFKHNDGSMNAPWDSGELEQAAAQLSKLLACDLRPNIADQIQLEWPRQETFPMPFAATVTELRRRLGYYREIGEAPRSADYRLKVDWHPVSQKVWQLSIRGVPTETGMAVVQAATYIEAEFAYRGEAAGEKQQAAPRLLVPRAGQPASDYLSVEVLDISRSDRILARADLRVRLRLVNRASKPIEYGLSLSGGHYLQCVTEPRFYRHERYGYTEGRLAPGQSVVAMMAIEGARHNPNPFFGTAKCAGFRELEGLEDFAKHGHKVTQFIRWTL